MSGSDGGVRRRMGASVSAMTGVMVVVLPVFWTMGQLSHWWAPPLAAVIAAVMLGVSLPRAVGAVEVADWPVMGAGLLVATVLATVAAVWTAAGGAGRVAGAGLFAVVAGVTVWLRRFGRWGKAVGLGASLPLMAALVAPMPATLTWDLVGWVAAAGAAAVAWAFAVGWLAGGVAGDGGGSGSVRPAGATQGRPAGATQGRRRMPASTRFGLQLGVAVGLAFAAAQLVDEHHVVWPVLTALIVLGNNRGRGDVVWKGAQRLVGALVGTAAATGLVGLWPVGDARSVVAVFGLIALGSALRPFGYVYWAGCVTAGLSFLYGYLGQGGMDVLSRRLLGILVGGVIAIAVAWFLLPVRTSDVVALRMAAVRRSLAAVTAARDSGAACAEATAALRADREQLAQMLPTVRAARLFGIGSVRSLEAGVRDVLARADAVSEGVRPDVAPTGDVALVHDENCSRLPGPEADPPPHTHGRAGQDNLDGPRDAAGVGDPDVHRPDGP